MVRLALSRTTGAGKGGRTHLELTTSTGREDKVLRPVLIQGLAKTTPLEPLRYEILENNCL